jgi:hypothetical protein
MSIPTIAEICDAVDIQIGEVLVTAGDLVRSESYDELSEGINDENVLQVYPESIDPVAAGSETHKRTLGGSGGPVIHEAITVFADYYARQRSHIDEDMATLVAGIQAVREELKNQDCPTPFGLENVGSFQWSGNRVIIEYAGVQFMAWRWTLVFEVF